MDCLQHGVAFKTVLAFTTWALMSLTKRQARRNFTRRNGNGKCSRGNQSIGQYLSLHKDSFSNPPTDRRLEEAVVGDWPKMMEFKAS
ncbi:hypothetical protein AVEN_116739-1 [Araneus ventricosus]|uniref:Uncharacterized protein n=1 Tax=Araneus ventricosus TaxID=182803 RepID=A0A4Y1ZXS6_ARAVE|nr:hypothetical protein AVEN_116739-1 [Araneus ventricosus]